jgi:hypothetical protein
MSDSKSTRPWKPTRLWNQESRDPKSAGRRIYPGAVPKESGRGDGNANSISKGALRTTIVRPWMRK